MSCYIFLKRKRDVRKKVWINNCNQQTSLKFSLRICGYRVYKGKRCVSQISISANESMIRKSRNKKQMNIQWATSWENLFMPYANNKGADQPAHPRSLISAFVVRFIDTCSMMSLVSVSEIAILYLASVAVQAGFCLILSPTPKTGFLLTSLKWFIVSWVGHNSTHHNLESFPE